MQILKVTKTAFLMLLLSYYSDAVLAQEENLSVMHRWVEWSDGANMLAHHLNRQAFGYLDKRDEKIAGLKSEEDWKERQREMKQTLLNTVGPFPEKTPLNAKVSGVIKKEGFRVEKIIYESMPGFYVTGSLFIPEATKGKTPAILYLSGHTPLSYLYPPYQVVILNLVKKGFIVFAIDCVGQGERIQHYDPEKKASVIPGSTTREHSYLGKQTLMSGVSIARYFIWDGIRAVDYLLTRREVDPDRLGVTGHSGGGAQSAYNFAFDERLKAGAPVNYITGFRRLMESIGPQDAEQNFYHGIKNGITHADLLEVRAPAPALISAGTRDFFSIQGARETFEEVKKAYSAFGKEENITLIEDDFEHGYTKKLREGTYAFFQESLDFPGNPNDEAITAFEPGELTVTATGQVATSFKDPETVFSLNKKETQEMLDQLERSRQDIATHLPHVRTKATTISGYTVPQPGLNPVFRGRYQRQGYTVEMYALYGEANNYVIPLLLFIPEQGEQFSSVIYLHPEGKAADSSPGGNIEKLVKMGYVVAAPDVIGTGETAGGGETAAMLIGRSVLGIQAGDVTRVADFLKTRKDVNSERIFGMAFDEMCPMLLHAAAFDTSIQAVSLIGAPVSYKSMVMNKYYDQGFFRNAVAGALTAYDLSDLIASLAPRKVAL
ncbi:MAG TPA: acetylxylan esterase, partial [Cyclobacteriaceae bacterium]|nr:acetylxylan esterase [Cyclobacteriaceae bacterium]